MDPQKNETPFNEQGSKDDTFTQVVELLREFLHFLTLGYDGKCKLTEMFFQTDKKSNRVEMLSKITKKKKGIITTETDLTKSQNFLKLTFNNHLTWIKPNYKSVQFFQDVPMILSLYNTN